MYLHVLKTDGKRERLHAPGYDSPEQAIGDFVNRRGIYSEEWLRLDLRGEPRYIRRDQIVEARPIDGPSQVDV